MRTLGKAEVEAACMGGGVFACGGGGWLSHGLENGHMAVTLGRPKLLSIDEIPQAGVIITLSAIGAPAATSGWEMWPRDYIRAFELVKNAVEQDGQKVVAVMNAQNGYSSSVNCWMPAAYFDLPVLDAAGDIRAHPTIKLGAMGYAGEGDVETIQAVVGGNRSQGAYLEVLARGSLFKTANILRVASVQSGGFIASARLPLPVAEVRARAALGSVSKAIELGEAMLEAQETGPEAVLEAVVKVTGGVWLARGTISSATLRTEGGFDFAQYTVLDGKDEFKIFTMNEHMAVDKNGTRVSSFPDTICLFDVNTGLPLKTGDTQGGMSVALLHVDRFKLPLSSGVKDAAAYPELEAMMGIELGKYALGSGKKTKKSKKGKQSL